MKPPKFWYETEGLAAQVLAPLARIYAGQTRKRLQTVTPIKLDIPVICVGNINAGGTGKTPMVIALIERLAARGITAHVVSRGYGGTVVGPMRVSERDHLPEQVGDEPMMLSSFAPVWVSRDRALGGNAAQDAGADVIILDDALQNPALVKDLTIICVDAARGFGNGCVIPAGPLREPIADGLARGDILVSIGPGAAQGTFAKRWSDQVSIPHLTAHLAPLQTGRDWAQDRLFAFAGIGHPEKFFATLRDLGADVVGTQALEDHQPITPALMQRLVAQAASLNAQLVTTEKDAARLPMEQRRAILTLPVRLDMADWAAFDALVDAKLTP